MKRTTLVVSLVAITAAGLVGTWLVKPSFLTARHSAMQPIVPVSAAQQRALYYQDPDGRPVYAQEPGQTADGRAYRPVYVNDDKLSFELPDRAAADVMGVEAPAQKQKIKYYRNPMGLADTSPVPKKDSMGMDYIAVYEGDQPDDGSVKVSLGKLQRSGAKYEPAALRIVASMIRAPGTIQLDERRVSVISMRSETWIQKVEDVTTGSRVRKGEPLMQLYSPAISSAAAEYITARSSDTAAGNFSRGAKQRLLNLNVPEAAIRAMEKGQSPQISIEWTAPRDGIVLERNAVEGMRVGPGDVLFRVADTSVVWTLIDVAERDLALLAVGQEAAITARGYPGRIFRGKVTVIYPQVNKESRTVRVRIELPNADFALLPDMYVDAEINIGSPAPVLTVPASAVLDSGSRKAVFVDKGEGRLEPRQVQTGARGGGYVEIREGLAEGDRVVVSANFLIDAESNLNAALKGFSEAGAPQ